VTLETELEQRVRHHIGQVAAYAGTLHVPEVAARFERDPLFSIFGLYGPAYLTARFGGGLITSIHRKLGDLVEDSVQRVVVAQLGLDPARATYAAQLESGNELVTRTADCFIDIEAIPNGEAKSKVLEIAEVMRDSLPDSTIFAGEPRGIGFEIRGCYQSADSKRAQADDAMARHLSERAIVPLMLVFCDLSNESIMRRYRQIWHLREGAGAFDAVARLTGFDLRGFWQSQQDWIDAELGLAFQRLSPELPEPPEPLAT